MPATNQWAVSALIREVLADPDLARRASSGVCPRAGLQDLVDAGAAAVIGAQRYERTPVDRPGCGGGSESMEG